MRGLLRAGLILLLLTGCSARLERISVDLSSGQKLDYVLYRTDNKGGIEGVGRDVYDTHGRLVDSKWGSGQSLPGQVLNGIGSSAVLAGGAVGAAAALRPTQIRETNNLSNSQDQGQTQGQGQKTTNSNSNTNTNTANGGAGGQGGTGGTGSGDTFNGCQSQGNSNSQNPHC